MKIRTKFGVLMSLILLLTTGALAVSAYWLEYRLIRRHMSESRAAKSSAWTAVCRQALTAANDLLMINYVKMLSEQPDIAYAYFTDLRGKILVHSDKRFIYKDISQWQAPKQAPPYEITSPVAVGGGPAGTAVVGFSEGYERQRLQEALYDTLRRIGTAASAVALIGVIAAIAFAHFLSRPIRILALGAEKIGKGDFSTEVKITSADELGELTRCFNQMAKNLAVLDELKDEFISTVSHDLRNPLAAISMYADFMLHQDENCDKILPKHREYVQLIMDNARRLGVFITNILDAAKIKAGRMEYHAEPVSLEAVARNVQSLFGIVAKRMNILMILEFPPDLPPVLADPERLDQVIANLVSNALKFTPEGGRITLGARLNSRAVEIHISDTGKGISPEDLPRLFERFKQADVADQHKKKIHGTGLGLYIVKQTVEDMGGSVQVRSQLGRGTRFSIRLPVAPGGSNGQDIDRR